MLTGTMLMALLLAGAPAGPRSDLPDMDATGPNPAARCAECHEDIYAMWRRSLHSLGFTDPVFQAAYMQAFRDTAGAAAQLCLRCHAPAAALSSDPEIQATLRDDGVTCDFCHSVAGIDLSTGSGAFEVRFDGVKHGPLADADSPAHGVVASPLHQTAEFCAGCHEYVNASGVPIFSTYSEWKSSPQAARGQACQTCHMPTTPGETVVRSFGTDRRQINLHDISGGHSREQVQRAATVQILSLRRKEPRVAEIEVEVANVGSGHSIPTGIPTRKLVLEVRLFVNDEEVQRFELLFHKLLLDDRGDVILEDHRTILDAKQVMVDTRLRAGEHRRERFTGSVPPSGVLSADARLRYLYEPQILTRKNISIEMATDRSTGRP